MTSSTYTDNVLASTSAPLVQSEKVRHMHVQNSEQQRALELTGRQQSELSCCALLPPGENGDGKPGAPRVIDYHVWLTGSQ